MVSPKDACRSWASCSSRSAGVLLLFIRAQATPHLFQIVELPHLGAEDVDDRIAGIDQDPIAIAQALDTRRGAGRLALPQQTIRNGTYMRAGASGRHHHRVG